MEYGHIVLANSKKGIMPAIIRFVTGGPSHSLITIPDILNIPMCMEAAESGVSTLRFDKNYLENADQEIEIWKVLISQEQKDEGIKKALDYLQTGYGFLELPWFIWRRINEIFGNKYFKKNNNWSLAGIICSEHCVQYLTNCGLGELFKDYGDSSVHCKDLKDIMLANPKLFKRIK